MNPLQRPPQLGGGTCGHCRRPERGAGPAAAAAALAAAVDVAAAVVTARPAAAVAVVAALARADVTWPRCLQG